MSAETPRLLGGRYEVGDLIGRGGMAEVHLGHDTRLGRPVAIKILRSDHARDASFIHRFRREAQSVAGLSHNSIVAVYDSGEDRAVESGGAGVDVPYIVMEYVQGKTLRTVLNERGALPPAEAARITEGVLDALAYSHRMGIVHRDIKPANVMVGEDGAVKVMDFGIARAIADTQATMTQTSSVIGTAQYLSPEQAEGQTVDARSDLYSTACLLFELMTGETPFSGDPISLTYQHVGKPPPVPSSVNPDIPPELDAVVLHALTKDREQRYQDAATFRADLQAARLGLPISSAARRTLSGADAAAAAALGAGGAAAGAGMATATVPQADPTEVMAAGPPRAQQHTAYQRSYADPDTSNYPVAGQPPEKRKGAFAWVLLALAMIAAVALLAFAALQFSGGQDEDPAATTVSVPNVVGAPQSAAASNLRNDGFDVAVEETPDAEAPAGQVIDQDPVGGSMAEEGSTVTITVSTGPGETTVPSLEGMTEEEAAAALQDAGLVLGSTSTQPSDADTGTVISSDPEPSTSVAKGTRVSLVLAGEQVTMPNLVSLPEEEAKDKLADLGIQLTIEVKEAPNDQYDEGIVAGHDPGNEAVLEDGDTVLLIVSTGPSDDEGEDDETPSPSDTPTTDDTPSPSDTPTPGDTPTTGDSPTTPGTDPSTPPDPSGG